MVTFTRVQKATAIIPHFSSTLSLVGSGKANYSFLTIVFREYITVAVILLLIT
jgi:hypothetical protein